MLKEVQVALNLSNRITERKAAWAWNKLLKYYFCYKTKVEKMLWEFKLSVKTGFFFFLKTTKQGEKSYGGKCNVKRPLSSV